MSRICSNPACGKKEETGVTFQRCSRCHEARYCSRDCQRAHWKDHKNTCVPPAPVSQYSVAVQKSMVGDLESFLNELRVQDDLRQNWFDRAFQGYTKFGRGLLAVHFSKPDHLQNDLASLRAHLSCRFRVAYIAQDDPNLAHLSPTLPLAELRAAMSSYDPAHAFVILAHLLLPDESAAAVEADKSAPLSGRVGAPMQPARPAGPTPTLDAFAIISQGPATPVPAAAPPASRSADTLRAIEEALAAAALAEKGDASPVPAAAAAAPAGEKRSGMTLEDRIREIAEAKRQLAEKGLLDGELPTDLRLQFAAYERDGAPVMRVINAPNGPCAVCLRRHDDPPSEKEFASFLADLMLREQRWKDAHPGAK